MTFYADFIALLEAGVIKTPQQLQCAKLRLCEKYKRAALPSNSEILAHLPQELKNKFGPLLMLKPSRTISGIVAVAVMSSPAPCPHGKCIYCPGGIEFGTAQSYTGYEPAALRARNYEFDPYCQVSSRIQQLRQIGHPTDKIELIIMGGTFTARSPEYQEWFVRRCFEAMNSFGQSNDEKPTGTYSGLQFVHEKNSSAKCRCVGLTIETRPDFCTPKEIDRMLTLGATRVELGVQTLQDDILIRVERGHDVAATVRATRFAKDSGLKVCYHLMPGLPGASPETDIETCKKVFGDEQFRPDMLKLYPTLVIKGTKLYDLWARGEYEPYSTEEAAQLIARIKELVPRWIRIQRIQRDIPAHLIVAGVKRSDLRNIVGNMLASAGKKCRCIRCREMRNTFSYPDCDELKLFSEEYAASGSTEVFLSFETPDRELLAGYARMRFVSEKAHRSEFRERPAGIIRELRVVGTVVPISEKPRHSQIQHRGLGQLLLENCESMARKYGIKRLLVMSGIGVMNYYQKFGYERLGPYMAKIL